MKKINTCCGAAIRHRVVTAKKIIPQNPKVQNGVAVIYLGEGYKELKGAKSGLVYYASDHHRHFKIAAVDADFLLQNNNVILKP